MHTDIPHSPSLLFFSILSGNLVVHMSSISAGSTANHRLVEQQSLHSCGPLRLIATAKSSRNAAANFTAELVIPTGIKQDELHKRAGSATPVGFS